MNKLNKIINSECKHKPYRDKDNKCWYCKICENYLGDKSLSKKELYMEIVKTIQEKIRIMKENNNKTYSEIKELLSSKEGQMKGGIE